MLLMKDYDVLSQSEGYLFDLEEIASQIINGLIKDVYKQVWSQYLDSLEENLRNGTEVEKSE